MSEMNEKKIVNGVDISDYNKLEVVEMEIDGEKRDTPVIKGDDIKGKDKITLNITAR